MHMQGHQSICLYLFHFVCERLLLGLDYMNFLTPFLVILVLKIHV